MWYRHEEVGGYCALRGALRATFCVITLFFSVGMAPLPVLGVGIAGQTDERIEQVEAPTPTTLVSVAIDTSLRKAVLDELVDIEDPEDEDQTEHYVPRTFADTSYAGTVTPLSSGDGGLPSPFRLRAFAGRAPPTV